LREIHNSSQSNQLILVEKKLCVQVVVGVGVIVRLFYCILLLQSKNKLLQQTPNIIEMSSPSDENDCPFVLELEIDDEISFKPLAKKAPTSSSSAQNRVLQPLNENKLTNYPPPKTPGALEKVKPCTPRTIKLRTVEKRELDQGRDFAPPSTQTSPKTAKATPLREDSRPALKIPPFPPLSFEDQVDLTANILPPNLQQFKRSFLDPDDNSEEKSSARFLNCSNLISSCSSFLAEGSSGSGGRRQSFLSSGDDYHRQESPDAEELLQKKVDDLEVRNAELSQEKVVLETQISELIASSSSRTEAAAGELSHADIQVKALTEQLEVCPSSSSLFSLSPFS
jgi:hypothetical protein